MSSLLCVPPIVEITRIPKLVVDFTSVPLTERRIGAFVPMGFIGTTRRSKSFERAQMHETRIPRWQIVDSIFYYFPNIPFSLHSFTAKILSLLLSSLDYIWCPTALQLDTLKLDTLKTLLLGYSTFCYCTRPEFKSTAEFFLFKKTASTDTHCYSTSTTKNHYFQGLVYRMRTFYCNPLLLMFFFLLLLLRSHTTILCVDSKELGQYFGSIQYCLAARLMKYLTLED